MDGVSEMISSSAPLLPRLSWDGDAGPPEEIGPHIGLCARWKRGHQRFQGVPMGVPLLERSQHDRTVRCGHAERRRQAGHAKRLSGSLQTGRAEALSHMSNQAGPCLLTAGGTPLFLSWCNVLPLHVEPTVQWAKEVMTCSSRWKF